VIDNKWFMTPFFPLEVKAGSKGSMQSLYLFMEAKKIGKGIRVTCLRY
jgi:hypothetical protein